jgi:predicted DNA-binding protein (MmcQ/YjbR family)
MNLEFIREYCISKYQAEESFPFDASILAFKIGGKIFALFGIDDFKSINLKCDPEKSIELRERYEGINPGFHMNKKHWNTVNVFQDVDNQLVLELIDHSYDLVLKSLPKKIRDGITI